MKKLLAVLAAVAPLSTQADVIDMFDVFASSREDWSTSGTQGENGWSYGYYDNTNNPNVFVPFDETLHWNVNNWDHGFNGGTGSTNAPWTGIRRTGGHPNTTAFTNPGVTTPGPDFHAVRRYTVPAGVSGQVGIDWHVIKNNVNGTGVTANILLNGAVVDTATIGGADNTAATAGTGFTTVSVSPGDYIDIALTPDGAGGAGDGSDDSNFAMDIGFITPVNGTLIADSVADWVDNAQGANGWTYGYFDVTNVGSAVGDFIEFDSGMWNAGTSRWDIGGGAPWTEVGQTASHPNGENNAAEHWATRRYEVGAGEAGDLYVEFSFGATNRGGAGVGLNVLFNGVLVDARNIDGNDAVGMTRGVLIPGAQVGDIIDISLTPVGPDGNNADGSDGSYFSANIFLVPEPGTLVLLSLTGVALIFRRRR